MLRMHVPQERSRWIKMSIKRGVRPPAYDGEDAAGELQSDYLGFLTKLSRGYGPVVSYLANGEPHVLITDPVLVHEVLTAPFAEISVGPLALIERDWFGNGLFLNWGSGWRSRRMVIQLALSRSEIERFISSIEGHTRERFRDLPSEVDLVTEMRELTLKVVTEALFSNDTADAIPAVHNLTSAIADYFPAVAFGYPLEGADVSLRAAVKALDEFVFAAIERRRRLARPSEDLFAALLGATEEDGTPLSDEAVRDEVVALILAGHGTTSATLAFAMSLLGRHGWAYERWQGEVNKASGTSALDSKTLASLPFTQAVVAETLRLYPILYTMDRIALVARELGGYTIGAGCVLVLGTWMIHRDPRFFANPAAFDPDRFSPARVKDIVRYAYFPFGGGPRICAGIHFAQLEATVVLATIARHCRFRLANAAEPTLWLTVGLRPRPPITAYVEAVR